MILNQRLKQAAWAVCPWLLYAAGLALHIFVRGQANDIGPAAVSPGGLERWLFHGMPPVWLQDWTPDSPAIRWLAILMHASWFYGPIVLALLVQVRSGTRTAAQLIMLHVLLLFSSDAFYAIQPTKPPWMEFEVVRLVDVAYGSAGSVDSNPVAAVPSLHVALPFLYTLWFARRRDPLLRRLAPCLAVWTACVAWSVVYGGEHYMVDALAGAAWAVVVYAGGRLAVRNVQGLASSSRRSRRIAAEPPSPVAPALDYDDLRAA